MFGLAASGRKAISIPDLEHAADYPLRGAALAAGFNSVLVVPLAGQREVLGALVLQRKTRGDFPPNTIGLMYTLAHQSVLAMNNAGLFREVDRRGRELSAAHDTVQQQAAKLKEQTEQLLSWNALLEERVATQLGEIERISRLQRFLAPQVAQVIASSDGHESLLASHRREVTVVFCDLRGFTAFTESAEPEEVMAILRQYHAALGELVYRYEGTLERFAGDGILILFNDPIPYPDHAERAVRMAVEMRDSHRHADRELAQPRPCARLRDRHRGGLCHAGADRLRPTPRIRRGRQRHQSRFAPVRRGGRRTDHRQPAGVRHGRALGRGGPDRRPDLERLQPAHPGARDPGVAGRTEGTRHPRPARRSAAGLTRSMGLVRAGATMLVRHFARAGLGPGCAIQ